MQIGNPIEQRNTGKGNPQAMLHFDRPLNNRQMRLLQALSAYDSVTIVHKTAVNMKDIAALTAQTGVEFAMFTRRAERMVIRGDEYKTNVDAKRAGKMAADGWRWSGHTHPGWDPFCLVPSDGDKAILAVFGQEMSCIVNSSGQWTVFERSERWRRMMRLRAIASCNMRWRSITRRHIAANTACRWKS